MQIVRIGQLSVYVFMTLLWPSCEAVLWRASFWKWWFTKLYSKTCPVFLKLAWFGFVSTMAVSPCFCFIFDTFELRLCRSGAVFNNYCLPLLGVSIPGMFCVRGGSVLLRWVRDTCNKNRKALMQVWDTEIYWWLLSDYFQRKSVAQIVFKILAAEKHKNMLVFSSILVFWNKNALNSFIVDL